MIEIGFPQGSAQDYAIRAGTGGAVTAGGDTTGIHNGTGTGVDATVAPQTTDPITSTSADLTTPEANRQYAIRDLTNRLPPRQVYATPCIWGDLEYWMDS